MTIKTLLSGIAIIVLSWLIVGTASNIVLAGTQLAGAGGSISFLIGIVIFIVIFIKQRKNKSHKQ